MITYQKMTVEEALRQTFNDQPSCIGRLAQSDDAQEFTATITQTFSVTAKYAKAILKEYLDETLKGGA